jgi:hypothetical protein
MLMFTGTTSTFLAKVVRVVKRYRMRGGGEDRILGVDDLRSSARFPDVINKHNNRFQKLRNGQSTNAAPCL